MLYAKQDTTQPNVLFDQRFIVLTLMLSHCDLSGDPSVTRKVSIAGTKEAAAP